MSDKCPSCGSGPVEYVTRQGSVTLFTCQNCGVDIESRTPPRRNPAARVSRYSDSLWRVQLDAETIAMVPLRMASTEASAVQAALKALARREKKEHPWVSSKQAMRIALDHTRRK